MTIPRSLLALAAFHSLFGCIVESRTYSIGRGVTDTLGATATDVARASSRPTTRDDLVARFGQPETRSVTQLNGRDVECITWAWIGGFGRWPFWTYQHVGLSTLTAFVYDSHVVGMARLSTFPSMDTWWSTNELEPLSQLHMSRQEIEDKLGTANGWARFPMTSAETGDDLVYMTLADDQLFGLSCHFDRDGTMIGTTRSTFDAFAASVNSVDWFKMSIGRMFLDPDNP